MIKSYIDSYDIYYMLILEKAKFIYTNGNDNNVWCIL